MTNKFGRDVVLSTIDIGGYYRFESIFQIIAFDDSHRKPNPGHVPLLLEYSFEVDKDQKEHLLEDMCVDANKEFKERLIDASYYKSTSEEIMILLTLFTNSMFFVYNRNTQELSWFTPLHDDCHDLFWGQKFYTPGDIQIEDQYNFTTPSISEIPKVEFSEYYGRLFTYPGQNISGEEFTLPNIIDTLFRNYYNLEHEAKIAFLQASTFFYQSMQIWFESRSLTYTALISCFESLIHFDYKNEKYKPCEACETTQYAVMKKFRTFLGVDDLPTDDESRKYVKMLYDLRSKILHRGYLLQADLAIPGHYTYEEADQRSLLMNVVSITRKRIIHWLLSH